MSLPRLRATDLAGGAPVYWLLDLTWAGGVIRVAAVDLEVERDDGSILRYSAGLEAVSLAEAIDHLADASSSGSSVSIEARLPVDVPALVARGHDLSEATGELSRWVEGTTWERRRVVLRGVLTDPEYGAEDEPISGSLEAQVWQDESDIIPTSHAVLTENWDSDMFLSLAENDLGLLYPEIIGRPGVVSTDLASAGWIAASRMRWVDKQNIAAGLNMWGLTGVIAGHHVTAAEVRANTEDHTGGERFIVYNTFDRKGHPVAIIPSWTGLNDPEDDPYVYDVASPYSWGGFPPYGLGVNALHSSYQPVALEPREVWVGWLDPAGGGGRRGRNGRLIEGAGEVLEWLLSRTSIPVDWGRCAVAIEQLRGFRLGFVLDDGAKPWEYAKEHILPLLPVSIVSGPDGLYPLVWRYGATAIDAVHRLDTTTDLGLYRASAIKVDRSKVINEFSLEYGYNIRTDTYHGKVILGADGVDPGRASMLCTLSQRRYRRPDGGPLVVSMAERTTCVYDTATAWQIVEWWAQALALGRRRVTYRGGLDRWGHVERGQVVTITDPEVGLDAQVALLESVTSDDSPTVAMGLLLLEDPARDLTRP